MSSSVYLEAASALWLGILTSISPCPLATNVAAVSFIGKQFSSTPRLVYCGASYVLGRVLAYVGLGWILVAGLLAAPRLSSLLQGSMNQLLGPTLILAGMVLLDLLHFRAAGYVLGEKLQVRAARGGPFGAGILGFLFALSFCPISAALFFGSLVPLSVQHGSTVAFPMLYGVGTGLPVFVLSMMVAFGAKSIGALFHRISRAELWARRLTGAVFILAGIYYMLVYIFEII
jgi:cytochrome c-type biogenesis protein